MSDIVTNILLFFTLCFGIARFLVPVEGKINKKDFFKDFAHIFVGILLGWAIAGVVVHPYEERVNIGVAWLRWAMFIGLTVLEVVAFFVRRK